MASRRLTATRPTKREADAWLAGHTTDIGRGTWVDPDRGRVTLADYAGRWIDQRHDLRPRTADDYRDIIRVHIVPALGATQLGRLTPADVRAWNAELSGRVPGRARKAYRLLRTILNTAVADELIVRNPCRVRGAGQDRSAERPTATVAQVAALADAVDDRLRALVLLAAWCGLRWAVAAGPAPEGRRPAARHGPGGAGHAHAAGQLRGHRAPQRPPPAGAPSPSRPTSWPTSTPTWPATPARTPTT